MSTIADIIYSDTDFSFVLFSLQYTALEADGLSMVSIKDSRGRMLDVTPENCKKVYVPLGMVTQQALILPPRYNDDSMLQFEELN